MTESPPLVTVVIPTYQRPDLVKHAIQSVLNQTYGRIELVVVEDGSDSGIERWISENHPEDVQYYRHADNRGLAAARNTGWQKGSGEFVAFLDDDDRWKETKIEKQIDLVISLSSEELQQTGVVYCGLEDWYPEEESRVAKSPVNCGDLRASILSDGIAPLASTYLLPRHALERIDGFDESLESSIDADLWMKLADERFEVRCIDEPLVENLQFTHVEQMTSRTNQRISGTREFVEKWSPTVKEWIGDEAGAKFANRYFARVIANLAANKLDERDIRSSARAVWAIYDYSDDTAYNTAVIAHRFGRVCFKHVLPERVSTWLRER